MKKPFLRQFRNDGYVYQKSGDGKRIREDHIPLKCEGQVILTYYTTQTEATPKMHRRIYKLPQNDSFHLFHYLQDEDNVNTLLTIPEPSYPFTITEYSPRFSNIYGNQTVLIVLSEPLFNFNILCEFDGINVQCESILPQVLKCQTPNHINGEISIQLKDGISNTYLTPKYPFSYYHLNSNYNNIIGQKRIYDDINPMHEKIVECKKRLVIQNLKSDNSSLFLQSQYQQIQQQQPPPLPNNSILSMPSSDSIQLPPPLPLSTPITTPTTSSSTTTNTFNQENDHENIINNAVKDMFELINSEEQLRQCEELDENGYSLLHYASIYNYSDLISILVNGGFPVNQESSNKLTPLHLAVENESIKSINILLKLGAVDTKDSNGIYASSKAFQLGYIDIANEIRLTTKSDDIFDCPSPYPASDLSTTSSKDDENIMETTLQNMTIGEKLAYVLSINEKPSDVPKITDHERDDLMKILPYMNRNELDEINHNVRKIQKNVKGWLAKRHYRLLEERIVLLQKAAKNYLSRKNTRNSYDISSFKKQISAVLVIQRAYRKWSKESKENFS